MVNERINSNKGQIFLVAARLFRRVARFWDEGDVIRFVGYFDSIQFSTYQSSNFSNLNVLAARKYCLQPFEAPTM